MAESVAEEYRSSLADLNCNSKPLINMLTILAEENLKYSSQIVKTIADHVLEVSPESKLPCLYLIDSIIKNVRKQYLPLFSQNIVHIFASVFEKVDENTRMLLYKLRQTWNEIFPNKILYNLDMRVKKVDPAWPVTAQPPPQSIHINPKFFPTQNKVPASDEKEEAKIKARQDEVLQQLFAKKEQLRQLEQKKREIAVKQLAQLDATNVDSPPSTTHTIDPRIVAKMNPKLSQRDPRLQKVAVASVLKKNLAQTKQSQSKGASEASHISSDKAVPVSKPATVPSISSVVKVCDKPASKSNSAVKSLPKEESIKKPLVAERVNNKESSINVAQDFKGDKKSKSEKDFGKREHNSSPTSPTKKKKKKLSEPTKEETSKEMSPKKSFKVKGSKKSDSPRKSPQKSQDFSESKKHIPRAQSPVRKSDKRASNRADHPSKIKIDSDSVTNSKSFDRKGKRIDSKECDTDLRKVNRDQELRTKRELQEDVKENFMVPPEKKIKEELKEASEPDSLFGHEDQDYRQLSKEGKFSHHKGWALYKAAHPDEFKSPRHSSAHGPEEEDNHHANFQGMQRSSAEHILKNVASDKIGPRPLREMFDRGSIEYDRLGRPRLHKMKRNDRYGPFPPYFEREAPLMPPKGMVPSDKHFQDFFLSSVLSDPKDMLRQAEERFRLGRISEADFNDIRKDLERMRCSEEYRKVQDYSRGPPFGNILNENHENFMKVRNNENLHFPQQGHVSLPPSVRTFRLDNKSRTLHFVDDRAIVLMDNGEPRELTFRGDSIPVFIQGLKPITLRFDGNPVEFELDGRICSMKFGTPSRELYINNRPYEAKFGGPPIDVMINGRIYSISLGGPPPQVQVSEHPVHDLYHKFLTLSRGNPEIMPPDVRPGEGSKEHHSNKMPFDVDMRSNSAPNRNPDTRDMDWRHAGPYPDAPENQVGYEFQARNKPPFPNEAGRCEPKLPDQVPDKRENPDFVGFPPDRVPPRHPEHWNFSPQFQSENRTYSPRHSPPHNAPPGEWDQPPHPTVPRPFNPVDNNHNKGFEGMPQPWVPRNFNHEGPQPFRPPVSESGNLFMNQRNSPNHFEPYPEFCEARPVAPPPPRLPPPPNYPMPMMPRPPFNPHQTRPEFMERPPVPGRLQRPPMPPHWMNNTRPPAPVETTRLPVLPPPPQPPLHMRMPETFLRPPQLPEPSVRALNPPTSEASLPTSLPPPHIPSTIPATPIKDETNTSEAQVPPTIPAPNPLVVNLDVTTLFEKLVAAGIITKAKPETPVEEPAAEDEEMEEESKKEKEKDPNEEAVPQIELSLSSLKTRYTGVISALYRGSQCASCGMRFKEIHGERYSRHLDWHFRVNRREKDGVKKAFSRKWYYEVEDWIQFEEFEDFEERTRSFFELQADEQFQVEVEVQLPSVPVSGQETEACVVCSELFQLFWVEEEEEWHLKNAVRHDGQAYHPSCYEDYKKVTEAPAKETSENEGATSPDIIEDKVLPVKEEPLSECEDSIISEIVDMLIGATVEGCEKAEEVPMEMEQEEEQEIDVTIVKEEPLEEELQGKPGEEEIIGLITETEAIPECQPVDESEKVVFRSGGITMKVRAESIKPASPLTESSTAKENSNKSVTEEKEEELEFRPPTPDPRFQVLPPVQRGTELSGLCTIM